MASKRTLMLYRSGHCAARQEWDCRKACIVSEANADTIDCSKAETGTKED